MSERRRFAPYGAQRRRPGRHGPEHGHLPGPDDGRSGRKVNVKLRPGDVLRVETPGGGGYGQPGS